MKRSSHKARLDLVYVFFLLLSLVSAVTVAFLLLVFRIFIAILIHATSSLKSPNLLHKLCMSKCYLKSWCIKHKEVIVNERMSRKKAKKSHILLWSQLKTAMVSARFELQLNGIEPNCTNWLDSKLQSVSYISCETFGEKVAFGRSLWSHLTVINETECLPWISTSALRIWIMKMPKI